MVTFFEEVHPSLARIMIITFIAGFAWETFETMNDIAGAPLGTHDYYIDSVKDLYDDVIGGFIACFFLRKK